jgi:cytochrome c biogenesis protein CcmG/thiol:disulfide interchange protein DsbE
MPVRSKYALIGVLVALLAGGFIWKYGDSTAPVDPDQAEVLKAGWHQVDQPLPSTSDALPGIHDAEAGIPREGTYVVNLWASFCGPCKQEMPWLAQLQDSGDARVIGVTRDNLLAEAEKAMRQRGATYPNVRDEFGDFMESIGDVVPAQYLPSTFIVVDGTITWAHLGPFDSYADLHDSVTQRL